MKQQRFALLLVVAILTGLLPISVMAVTEEVDGQASSAIQPLDDPDKYTVLF